MGCCVGCATQRSNVVLFTLLVVVKRAPSFEVYRLLSIVVECFSNSTVTLHYST